ncbi:hypothetical protein F2P56_008205 [Juglans regia]|uniref:Reverse transcriptase domain-containing protein n=1 Tax=Juglans regia TaxID=51240 RepID=A0A834CUW0_JUGRE|nr:hypothetical protein F2P56_008205 [Juglans regia]
MPMIDLDIIQHKLCVDLEARKIRQKRHSFNTEKCATIAEEVDCLLATGFIQEAHYPGWLSNVVLIKKVSGKWRMCMDFTNLNKAYPKDNFPLSRIDLIVDSTAGHQMLSFMDTYYGYNQIRLNPDVEEKTSFITDKGLYCYKAMSFGLKNTNATYQQLVSWMFKEQIDRNMEVYVDDLAVKIKTSAQHRADLWEAFAVLRRYQMKLNLAKCAFSVS